MSSAQGFWSGVYTCRMCRKNYTINKADSWNRCTPEYCHECTMRLDNARIEGIYG